MNQQEGRDQECNNDRTKDHINVADINDKKFDFNRLMEPSYIIALGTIFFYLIVSEYYISYFQRLSIPFYTLELPFAFFLYAGHWIAYSFLILILFIVILRFEIKENEVIKIKDHIILIISFFLILIISTDSVTISVITTLFLLTVISFYNILLVYKKLKVEQKNKYHNFISLRLVLTCILILIFTLALPYYLGINSAENLIKGSESNQEIRVEFKEKTDLSNKTFILITQSNNNYYLVERNQSAPKTEELHIIPNDQIKRISIKNNEKEKNTYYNCSILRESHIFFNNLFKMILSNESINTSINTTRPK
jgi:hypothetical protein